MNAERLKQVEAIYHAVLEIAPEKRESFFRETCRADADLRREVESLLSFENAFDSFIDKSPEALAAEMFSDKEKPADLSGSRIAHYAIKHLLGKGGMGEVYLAEDTKLDRPVALKILLREFSQNAERMRRRFVREAKAASGLNHPHIAHIYEIGEAEGVQFIAMEYVEGVSLREKIYTERVGLRTLLKYLAQVADGLAKAHSAGIVHRDLKPENLMISGDDFAKILDFGLAKLVEPQMFSDAAADAKQFRDAATVMIPPPLSIPGIIMGTVGYMSPEQARGQSRIDARSDIFSFGCILYEAVAGQQPFAGEDAVDSLHKIIHAPAPPLRDFNADAPFDLQRIVRLCLQKDPENRYQTIKDVAIELKELLREMEIAAKNELSVSLETNAAPRTFPTGERTLTVGAQVAPTGESVGARTTSSAEYLVGEARKNRIGASLIAVLLISFAASLFYSIYNLTAINRDKPALSFQTAKFTRLTTNGKASGVAVSPDGKYVAHIEDDGGRQSLWTRQVATQSNVQIVAPAAASYSGLIFSPDGNYIYYTAFSQESGATVLFRVAALGDPPQKLLDNVATSPVSFSPDGKQFAFVRATPREEFILMIANADGTNERIIAQYQNPPASISAPAWSPDGKRIAYRLGNFESNDSSVVETRIADGATKPLTARKWLGIAGLTWLADGKGLLMLATSGQQFVNQIWHLSYPEGEARQMTNDLNNYLNMSLAAGSDTLAIVQSQQQASISVAPASDPNRARFVTFGAGKADTSLDWTPDGRIVYQSNARGSNIWIMNADGTETKQLTANARINLLPEVSPDGRSIVFLSYLTGVPHLWRMNIDGSDQRQLTNSASGEASGRFSPDGKWLVYRTALGRWNVWKTLADGSGEPVQITDKSSRSPIVSANGESIAYFYREDNGPWRIAVAPFNGGKPAKNFDIPALPNPSLRWTPDNRAVAYIVTRDGISNVVAQPLDGGKPKPLTDFKQDRIFSFDYSPDGKQIAFSRGTINNDAVLISDFK